jgi:hypothetical protein
MGKGTVEKFGLRAIADALRGSDVQSARENLSKLVNSAVEVSGTVQKRVKRDGQCKLVIEPGDVPGFVVFVGPTRKRFGRGKFARVRACRFAESFRRSARWRFAYPIADY